MMAVLAFSCFGFDDTIENGWKSIKLLKTDRKTVEKILGSPKASRGNAYNYKATDFFIQIRYSTGNCNENNYEKGNYDVPADTVISYQVVLNQDLKLEDLKFQREKYERQVSPEQSKLIYYINKSDAILIAVSLVDGIEYVGQIYFDPSPADRKMFECKKPETATDKTLESKTVKSRNCKKPK